MTLTKKTITITMNNIRKLCSSVVTNMITTVEKTFAIEAKKKQNATTLALTKFLKEIKKVSTEKNNARVKRVKQCTKQQRKEKEVHTKKVKVFRVALKLRLKERKDRMNSHKDIKQLYKKCLIGVRKRSGNENEDDNDKKRKRCEDPCTELLCGLALCNANRSIQYIVNMTYEDIQQFPSLKLDINDFNGYIEDLKERLDNNEHDSLQQYILLWVEEYSKVVQFGKIKSIYMVGKKNKFKEIDTLNAQVKDKKDAKGDIMIELDDDKFIGLSVKAGNNATKSNYSIIKYFKDDVVKECQTIRAKYLTENGFPVFNKEDRPEVNKLFYDRFNPLFQKFREEVSKEDIGRQLVDSLYGVNLPYDLYEFNGHELKLLTNRNIDYTKVSFLECPEYYLKNNGINRNAAKMFFKLQTGDITYRVELRWKGVIHTAWPQFQIHSI
jgi:hypothetical protein